MQFISAAAHTMDTHLLFLEATHTRDGYDSDDADEAAVDSENQPSQQQNHCHCVSGTPRENDLLQALQSCTGLCRLQQHHGSHKVSMSYLQGPGAGVIRNIHSARYEILLHHF